MFLCAILEALATGFLHFEWLGWFCMGCALVLGVPRRQRGESFGAYFNAPRAIASNVLLWAGMIGFGYNLYALFTKHFSH
jgi:hypothetical protein